MVWVVGACKVEAWVGVYKALVLVDCKLEPLQVACKFGVLVSVGYKA